MGNLAIIPARAGSKRIKNKNMSDFCGKPLAIWSIEQAMSSKEIDHICVSTDDRNLKAYLNQEDYKGRVTLIDRPDRLAGDDTTQEQVIEHVLGEMSLRPDDRIVLLQPTSPLRLLEDIDRCIMAEAMSVNERNDAFLWTGRREGKGLLDSPHLNALNFIAGGRRKIFSCLYEENGSVYVFSVRDFNLTKSRYGFSPSIYIMQKWQGFEIDEEQDIEICRFFMKRHILKQEGNTV